MSTENKTLKFEVVENRLVLGEVRVSYPHLHKPKKAVSGKPEEAKYEAVLLIDKAQTQLTAAIFEAVKNACQKARETKGYKIDPNAAFWQVVEDGDATIADIHNKNAIAVQQGDTPKRIPEEIAGKYVLNVKSSDKPTGHSMETRQELLESDLKGGDYLGVKVSLGAWEYLGRTGLTCYINSYVKTRSGEAFGNGSSTSAMDEFAEFSTHPTSEFDTPAYQPQQIIPGAVPMHQPVPGAVPGAVPTHQPAYQPAHQPVPGVPPMNVAPMQAVPGAVPGAQPQAMPGGLAGQVSDKLSGIY